MIPFKSQNHQQIFRLIRIRQSASGAELSRATGLRASTIVYILQHLKDRRLIRETGLGNTTQKGGKKPVLWGVHDQAGYLLGIEVLRKQIRGVIVSLSGKIILRVEKGLRQIDSSNLVDSLSGIIFEMIHESSLRKEEIMDASIALPGIVDGQKGRILYSSVLNLSMFDLTPQLSEKTGFSSRLINDANAGALADQWYDEKPGMPPGNTLFLNYNDEARELGLGIVIGHQLYTGREGMAGEFFSPVPSLKAPSGKSIIDVYYRHREGDQEAGNIIKHFNRALSDEIVRMIGLFNPERIVIGGAINACKGWMEQLLLPEIKTKLYNNTKIQITPPEIKQAQSGIFSIAMGATAYALSGILEKG
jgi:predicted NBD/HSP70 family sugar kinase